MCDNTSQPIYWLGSTLCYYQLATYSTQVSLYTPFLSGINILSLPVRPKGGGASYVDREGRQQAYILLCTSVYCLDSCPTSVHQKLRLVRHSLFLHLSPSLKFLPCAFPANSSTTSFPFSPAHSLEERQHSDAGLLMFMLSIYQSRRELSGVGSVNWAVIRCLCN